MVTVEPLLQTQLENLLPRLHMNTSTYLRSLVIKDLHSRGLLPESLMIELLTGENDAY
jgi:hypothetical protein